MPRPLGRALYSITEFIALLLDLLTCLYLTPSAVVVLARNLLVAPHLHLVLLALLQALDGRGGLFLGISLGLPFICALLAVADLVFRDLFLLRRLFPRHRVVLRFHRRLNRIRSPGRHPICP